MRKKILIIDDDTAILNAYQMVIEKMDYEVVVFDNADSGIKYLKKNKDIDLLLIDIMMEGKDGITALKEIKKIIPDLNVIIITAYADWNIVKRQERFIKDYPLVQKPIEMHLLKNIIQIQIKRSESE